jgi:hypothetical protein
MLDRSGRRGSGGEFVRGGCRERVEARNVRGIREGCERRRKGGGYWKSLFVRFEVSNAVYAIDEGEM